MNLKKLFLGATIAGTVPAGYTATWAYQAYEHDQYWDCYQIETDSVYDELDICVPAGDPAPTEHKLLDEEPH